MNLEIRSVSGGDIVRRAERHGMKPEGGSAGTSNDSARAMLGVG